MSSHQIRRLTELLRQHHTDPTWVRRKRAGRRRSADQLSAQLDWDDQDSPDENRAPSPRPFGDHCGRDVSLTPKPSTAWSHGRHGRRHTDLSAERSSAEFSALEEENMLLKRQIEVMMGQIASGQHPVLPKINLSQIPQPPSSIDPSSPHAGLVSRSGFPPEPLPSRPHSSRRKVASGSVTDRPPRHPHSGSVTERAPRHPQSARKLQPPPPHTPPARPATSSALNFTGQSRTEIPCSMQGPSRRTRHIVSARSTSSQAGSSAESRDGRFASPQRPGQVATNVTSNASTRGVWTEIPNPELERATAPLVEELEVLNAKHKTSSEKVLSLEECLTAKDAELAVKEAELEHLRYLIGVKEGSEAQVARQMAYLKGVRSEDFVVNPEDNMAEVGKFTLRQIDADIDRFEDDLKEYEEHLRSGDDEALHGELLLSAIEMEKSRRLDVLVSKGPASGSGTSKEVGGHGEIGCERHHVGCPDCGRAVVVADKAVDCQLLDGVNGDEDVEDRVTEGREGDDPSGMASQRGGKKKGSSTTSTLDDPDGGVGGNGVNGVNAVNGLSSVIKVKKKVRRFIGIDPPYDTIVKDPDRWFKEKEKRRQTLTVKKILDAVTNIITEKITVDLVDDQAGTTRGEMPYVVYEYFLGKFGVRTLADFYLLELIEGLRMFHTSHPRIQFLARAMRLQWAGPKMEDSYLYFYLEVWRQLCSFLVSKKSDLIEKKVASNKKISQPDQLKQINETLNAANNKQASDIPIIFKRIQVWKAIRRSMKAILDHNWMPREYATAQEVSHDPLGIGKQELDIDEAMAYACSEMDDVTAERRAMLQKIFHYADADGNGRMDLTEFTNLMKIIDPSTTNHSAVHLFRKLVRDQDDETIDPDVFCDVMQRSQLDRPDNLNHIIRSWQGIGVRGFDDLFTEITKQTNSLLNADGMRALLDQSKGFPAQIQQAMLAFEQAISIGQRSIDRSQFHDIIRPIFMTDKELQTGNKDEEETLLKEDDLDGVAQVRTFARKGTFGGSMPGRKI